MDLKNGYKVIYEKIADGTRTFYATKNTKCDPTVDDKIIEAKIGEYKLIYEKDGRFYGSESGIPAEGDFCFDGFDKVFVEGYTAPKTRAARRSKPVESEATEPVKTEPEVNVEE